MNNLTEQIFKRTVETHTFGGKILLISKELEQFIGKEVEITVKEIEENENKGH